jgi:hypothetical protein
MSSAILYLAIIAIWACVLIPRWLKRGAVAPVAAPAVVEAEDQAASPDALPDAGQDEAPYVGPPAAEPVAAAPLTAEPLTAEPLAAGESRRRVITARRRLLMMLAGLEVTATALAVTGMAAVWVVIPPTVMLAGYLLLLREAAKADRERAQHEAEAHARARERSAARARARAARRATPAEGTSTAGVAAAAEALAAKLAAAPVPADYEDTGRDFAPGLAGKYTTSNADDEDYYAGYEAPRLRAVGD